MDGETGELFPQIIPNIARKKREDKVLKDCGCSCKCPKCGDILNDQAECTDTDLVRYICECGHKSEWNFDIAPVPVLMKGGKDVKPIAVSS